jgi:glycosyltransferase involved in cell wall biosynthesis
LIDVPAQLPLPLTLRIYAQLDDGSWHLGQVQRVMVTDYESGKAPLVPYSPFAFARAALAFRRAARARGCAVPLDQSWWSGLREAHAEYRRLAARGSGTAAPEEVRPLDPALPLPAGVTLVTHNLNREGAPLFLLELAQHFAARGARLQVVSAAAGPLLADYEKLGAAVQIVDVRPIHAARHAGELEAALARLGPQVDLGHAGLVIANTLSAFWGVHLAARAGRPSLFYIHESTTPAAFYHGHLPPAVLPPIERTFTLATQVSFLTESTRRYYRPLLGRSNHRLNPGWIEVAGLDARLAARPRDTLRAALGLDPATRLVVNVGTVCDRKGQHVFARAVDLLWRRVPDLAASARFLMVGGRDTLYDRAMTDLLQHLNRPNLALVAETGTPLDYYGAADLFVCSSFEESFPRVVLEAMAARLPIVATSVHGIPEMARDGVEAKLVPPGDTVALCEGMIALLRDPALGRKYAGAARERVLANYDSAHLLPRHAALAALAARP